MSAFTGLLVCPRCGWTGELSWSGCPDCAAEGIPVNVHPGYDLSADVSEDPEAAGLFRHRRLLPLPVDAEPVTLGEGDTPLLSLDRLAGELGMAGLYLKDETRGPTWSYKDRLAAVAITVAAAGGAPAVMVGTTGNHGAAAAAYAAAAGIPCVALTLASVPETMKVLMQVLGARVAAVEQPAERWTLMRELVKRGWVPLSGLADPPVGSNPFGIDGYKTIAYELVADLGRAPGVVLVPVAYGDGLIGLHRGFRDLQQLGRIERVPRLVAVEPLGPYAASLEGGGEVPGRVEGRPSVAFSIAGSLATSQGLRAIRESGGYAEVVADDDEILAAQRRLAATEGLYLEPSAAICLPAVERMAARGVAGDDGPVVLIGTSTGLKDVGATAGVLPDVPVIPPETAALDDAIGPIG